MKEHIIKRIKSIQWKKVFTWNYICMVIYSANMIVNLIEQEYDVAGAYFVAVVLCVIIHIKDLSLDKSRELIEAQEKLIDSLRNLVNVMEEHEKLNNPINKN